MAYPTSVNNQITDAVTQSNVKVVSEAPAMAMGTVYQAMGHSTGILFENAVASAQQQNALSQAAANMGIMQIYSLDTTATAGASEKMGGVGVPDQMSALLSVVQAFRNAGASGL